MLQRKILTVQIWNDAAVLKSAILIDKNISIFCKMHQFLNCNILVISHILKSDGIYPIGAVV